MKPQDHVLEATQIGDENYLMISASFGCSCRPSRGKQKLSLPTRITPQAGLKTSSCLRADFHTMPTGLDDIVF
ncbi:hypothetical protein [Acetomicrobium mobile]|uniref:hypothetical protein n=1 Tax=Acetomicrobium mobile TaxID=97477 RepID=UPI0026E99E4A|nr:hypothetical protein [Acetomicrobium mobile]